MKRKAFLLTAPGVAAFWLLPAIHQDQHYHQFSNQVEHWGIPNFWNVMSNLVFLIVAAMAFRRLRTTEFTEEWRRRCHRLLAAGIALTGFGSAFYHWQPSDATLVWDRAPMTIVFMCIFALTLNESAAVLPLVAIGFISIFYWMWTGDLRMYAIVQFYPLVAVPILSSFRTKQAGIWGMILFYVFAKAAEWADSRIAWIPGGAHAWKHVLAGIALLLYETSAG